MSQSYSSDENFPLKCRQPYNQDTFHSEGYPHHEGPTVYCEVHYRLIGTLKDTVECIAAFNLL